VSFAIGTACRLLAWIIAAAILALSFAVLYNWAPDLPSGIALDHSRSCYRYRGLASGVARLSVYLHFFNTFSVTYGSLGA